MVELDKQRHDCMQALQRFRHRDRTLPASYSANSAAAAAAASSSSSSSSSSSTPTAFSSPLPLSNKSKTWVNINSLFVRFPVADVETMLRADKTKIEENIEIERKEIKQLMLKLQELQPATGINPELLQFALKN